MTDWRWEDKSGRYRDLETGRFLSRDAALELVEASISASQSYAGTVAGILETNKISAGDWYALFRQEIKEEYIRQYLLGRGGLEQMSQADWGSIGGSLREQYKYLEGFYQELLEGGLSPAQIEARMRMYLNSAREAFERAQARLAKEQGFGEVAWFVMAGVENCDDCLEYAALGWQPVADNPFDGAYPGDGSTQCLCIVSPFSPVLTDSGWKPMMNVRIGEMVWTHRRRWRPVTHLTIKSSLPSHRLSIVSGVMCTDNHLWFTERGWKNSTDICNSNISMYNLDIGELRNEPLRTVWYRIRQSESFQPMHSVCNNMSLWELQGQAFEKLQEMQFDEFERAGKDAMAASRRKNALSNQVSGEQPESTANGLGRLEMADKIRWSPLELVLGGERKQEARNLPISMGLDHGKRSYSSRLLYSPYQRGLFRRQAGKSAINRALQAREIARKNGNRELEKSVMGMLDVREGFQTIPSIWKAPEILLEGVLPPGTALYDIGVLEDHSFCINGIFAHNTNCHCTLTYQNGDGAGLWEGE